ncbi:MAG: hypothetical protein JXA42_07420 [Anaerolineales bacterium]|nr:hypothetical protein [Anaerolineales bacterium]
MNNLTLEPFAVQLLFRSENAKPLGQWKTLLGQLLDEIGAECSSHGIIGHIKGFSSLADNAYLRGSKTSARYPADMELVEPEINNAFELKWSQNVLVYGLAWNEARKIVLDTSRRIANRFGLEIEWMESGNNEQHRHKYGL